MKKQNKIMDIYKLIGLSPKHSLKVIKQRIEYIEFQLDPARGINSDMKGNPKAIILEERKILQKKRILSNPE